MKHLYEFTNTSENFISGSIPSNRSGHSMTVHPVPSVRWEGSKKVITTRYFLVGGSNNPCCSMHELNNTREYHGDTGVLLNNDWEWKLLRTRNRLPFSPVYHTSEILILPVSKTESREFLILFGGLHQNSVSANLVQSSSKKNLHQTFLLDIKNETWFSLHSKGSFPSPRYHHCSAVVNNKMYLFGGKNIGENVVFDDMWRLDLSRIDWDGLQEYSERTCLRAADSSTPSDWIQELEGAQWTKVSSPPLPSSPLLSTPSLSLFPCPRYAAASATHASYIYLYGGVEGSSAPSLQNLSQSNNKTGQVLRDLWRFDSEKNQWKQLIPTGGDLPRRFQHRMICTSLSGEKKGDIYPSRRRGEVENELKNGENLIIMGGRSSLANGGKEIDPSEDQQIFCYNLRTNTFHILFIDSSVLQNRRDFTLTAFTGGGSVIFGGEVLRERGKRDKGEGETKGEMIGRKERVMSAIGARAGSAVGGRVGSATEGRVMSANISKGGRVMSAVGGRDGKDEICRKKMQLMKELLEKNGNYVSNVKSIISGDPLCYRKKEKSVFLDFLTEEKQLGAIYPYCPTTEAGRRMADKNPLESECSQQTKVDDFPIVEEGVQETSRPFSERKTNTIVVFHFSSIEYSLHYSHGSGANTASNKKKNSMEERDYALLVSDLQREIRRLQSEILDKNLERQKQCEEIKKVRNQTMLVQMESSQSQAAKKKVIDQWKLESAKNANLAQQNRLLAHLSERYSDAFEKSIFLVRALEKALSAPKASIKAAMDEKNSAANQLQEVLIEDGGLTTYHKAVSEELNSLKITLQELAAPSKNFSYSTIELQPALQSSVLPCE